MSWPTTPSSPPIPDKGIYPDLDNRVVTRLPAWLQSGPASIVEAGPARYVTIDGVAVGFAPEGMRSTFRVANPGAWDRDGDAIPDSLDILIGAKKTVLNGAAYKSTYRVIPYPGGDIPRTEGVCTDVVVRALRNAGIDLQKAVHEDAKVRPSAYPGIRKPDRSIDHRRVRNLLPYFKRYWSALPTDPKDDTVPWLPGDVVFLDTMHDHQPEHMGIVSDSLGASGLPLIVNNWTDGTTTAEMDLLSFVPVRGRFRVPAGALQVPKEHRGPEGLLARRGLGNPVRAGDGIPAPRQLLLVTTPTWRSTGGRLQRYRRDGAGARWRRDGAATDVTVGAAGLGAGRGLHGEAAVLSGLQAKREGDMTSPAGVFGLRHAFGPQPSAPYAPGAWPWRQTTERDRWIDDPTSRHYNTWQTTEDPLDWSSAEDLTSYRLGLVVEHNTMPVQPGAGSAIFLHVWKDRSTPTSGCTAMAHEELTSLLRWLEPSSNPVLVQVAGRVYE